MRHISGRIGVHLGIVLGLACGLVGCGGEVKLPTSPVTGKVSYKGEALKMGTVTFFPVKGSSASGEIKPDGTYSLNVTQGASQVMITSREPEEAGAGASPGKRKGPPKSHIPEIYGGTESKLNVQVTSGANKHDFDLK